MAEKFVFDERGAKRIAAAVRAVEGQPPARQSIPTGRGQPGESFLAELIEEDAETPGNYRWRKVVMEDRDFVDADPVIESPEEDFSAIEVNRTPGQAGRRVLLTYWGQDANGATRYIFTCPGAVRVKVTGNGTDGGQYVGKVWSKPASVAPAGDLSEADLGVEGADVEIWNKPEIGLNTHLLTAGTPQHKIFTGHLLGYHSATPVIEIDGYDFKLCVTTGGGG